MRKDLLYIFVTLVFAAHSYGQELLPKQLDTTNQSQRIAFQGNAFYLASGIQNNVSRRLLFGGSITEEDKIGSLDEHDELNRFGGDVRFRAQYYSNGKLFEGNENLSWMLDAGFETHFSAQYSKSLFGLAFFGNDNYRGETANFSNSFGRIQSFYTLGFGIHDKKSKSFIALNALLPTSDALVSVDRGTLYTAENADSVILGLRGETEFATSPAFFEGIGAALNFEFVVPVGTRSGNMTGHMSIVGRNLGAYYINQFSRTSADAVIQFDGYSLSNLVDLQENAENVLNDSLNVQRDTVSGWRFAPGFIQVGKVVEKYTDKQVQAFFGVRMYTNRVYRPLGYAGVHWNPVLNWSLGAQVSFGGYGNFRGGLYAGYSGDKLSLSIGTEDIAGVILGGQFGQSALIRMSWRM